MRLRNRPVDSSASFPACSRRRIQAKNPARMTTPTTIRTSISTKFWSAARIPPTRTTRPAADKTAPTMSNGRVGSGGTGSMMLRPRSRMITMITAWKRKAARQLIPVVIRPPINGPAAPIPPMPLISPNARARDLMSWNSRVVRM